MKTITTLAREFGLSRTTLLYYDRLRLLSPSYRTHAEARLYSDADQARLGRIVTFRRAGIPLATIKRMLDAAPAAVNATLESRLRDIQRDIEAQRRQQRFVVELLKEALLRGEKPARTKAHWVELLRACAFSAADMRAWHVDMERRDPRGHARFLKRLGLGAAEIERVRAYSRRALTGPTQPSASSASP